MQGDGDVEALARHGYDLVVAAEDERLQGVADEIAALGVSVHPVQVDLATADGVERLNAEATALRAPVEVLALNAGIGVGGAFHATGVADHLRLVMQGTVGPMRDIALLNAAAGLVIAGKARDLKDGLVTAADAVDSGRAQRTLDALVRASSQAAA